LGWEIWLRSRGIQVIDDNPGQPAKEPWFPGNFAVLERLRLEDEDFANQQARLEAQKLRDEEARLLEELGNLRSRMGTNVFTRSLHGTSREKDESFY
jgi:hypothetical protein